MSIRRFEVFLVLPLLAALSACQTAPTDIKAGHVELARPISNVGTEDGASSYHRSAAHVVAQYNMGIRYLKGLGVQQDETEAVEWFRKAGNQGYARAQYSMGMMYQHGLGVSQDYRQAVIWFRRAAEQDHGEAQNALATLYSQGLGVRANYDEAIKWARRSVEQGNIYARYNLGLAYLKGLGVLQEKVAAYALLDPGVAPTLDVLKEAVEDRNRLLKQMTNEEIDAARQLQRRMRKPGNVLPALYAYLKETLALSNE